MPDEWANDHEVQIHQGHGDVNPAVACRRRSSLPREICRFAVHSRLRVERSVLTGRQKSAEGVVTAQAVKARTVLRAAG